MTNDNLMKRLKESLIVTFVTFALTLLLLSPALVMILSIYVTSNFGAVYGISTLVIGTPLVLVLFQVSITDPIDDVSNIK